MAWIHANLTSKRRIQHLCSSIALFPPPFFVLYRITSLHSTSFKKFYNFCLVQDRRVLKSSFYCFIFTYIQLCLEWHEFELCGFTYMQNFFNSKCLLHNPWLAESVNVQIWGRGWLLDLNIHRFWWILNTHRYLQGVPEPMLPDTQRQQ